MFVWLPTIATIIGIVFAVYVARKADMTMGHGVALLFYWMADLVLVVLAWAIWGIWLQ